LKLLKDQHEVAADDVLDQGSAATAAAPKPRSVRATDKKSVKKTANKPSTSDATATVDVATETTEVCYLVDANPTTRLLLDLNPHIGLITTN
jgi:hypothetical protein